MTEVTKVCEVCRGSCHTPGGFDGYDCPTCSGTGRVPFDAAKEWSRFTAEQQAEMLSHASRSMLVGTSTIERSIQTLGADRFWANLSRRTALRMAKAAPKVAGMWEDWQGGWRARFDAESNVVCSVRPLRSGEWSARVTEGLGAHPTLASAQAACDSELLRLGYVLDDGEGE